MNYNELANEACRLQHEAEIERQVNNPRPGGFEGIMQLMRESKMDCQPDWFWIDEDRLAELAELEK